MSAVNLLVSLLLVSPLLGDTITISEFNEMYHFDDLSSAQFPYIEEAHLAYEKRLDNKIAVYNSFKADLVIIMEWSNNHLAGHYLNTREKMTEPLAEMVKAVKWTHDDLKDRKCVNLDKMPGAVNGNTLQEFSHESWKAIRECAKLILTKEVDRKQTELKKVVAIHQRLHTLEKLASIELLNGEYELLIADKKCGKLLENGKPAVVTEGVKLNPTYPESCEGLKIEDLTTQMQSVAVFYKKNRFRPVVEAVGKTPNVNGIYTSHNDKKNGVNGQNFMVQALEYSSTGTWASGPLDPYNVYYVIATHFKSKFDGAFSRKRLGHEIRMFMNINEMMDKNVILSGDLNAEIDEISYDLGMRIARLGDQNFHKPGYVQPANPLEITDIYTPVDFYMKKVYAMMESLENCEFLVGMIDPKLSSLDCGVLLQAIKNGNYKFESDTDPALTALNELDKLPMWIEANNFNTQRKIRVKELDYGQDDFLHCLRRGGVSPAISYPAFFGRAFLTKNDDLVKSQQKYFTDLEKKIEELNKKTDDKLDVSRIHSFRRTLMEFAKTEYLKKLKDSSTQAVMKNCMNLLYQEQKIDFILLRLHHPYNLEAKPYGEYQTLMQLSLPNKDYPSDHMASTVKITFAAKGGDSSAFKIKPIANRLAREVI